MTEFRTEHDSMGEVQVPADAYYGAQTQRAVENFPVSGWCLPQPLIHALGNVKLACAMANRDLGRLSGSALQPLDEVQIEALLEACRDKGHNHFVLKGLVDGHAEVYIGVLTNGLGDQLAGGIDPAKGKLFTTLN